MTKKGKNVAIIGCGVMGSALAERLSPENSLYLYDRNQKKVQALEKKGYGTSCSDLKEVFKNSEIVVLAIKPQGIEEFISSIPTHKLNNTIISILSGTTLKQLSTYFPNQKIIRMMPNLALLCGESATGLATNESLTAKEIADINKLVKPLGESYWIPEVKFNAFTSLAGSGTAFSLALIESMVEAGIAMGFSAQEAQQFVQQMIKGSLSLLETTQKHPAELKWQVTSPGGTTIAGLRKFEECGVRSGVINTFLGAYQRAIELSS